jgi:hypothetical protein
MSRSRQEFDRKTRATIILRATRDGIVHCEGCGLILGKKPFQIDHTLPEGLRSVEKKLAAEDGRLLGQACCHKPKTDQDKAQIAKMKRQRDKHSGAVKPAGKIASRHKDPRPATKQALPPRQLYKEIAS